MADRTGSHAKSRSGSRPDPHRDSPRVSVLLPCRDAAAFLPECMASIEAQTLRELEVLTIDDGSTDETASLLELWAGRDARVQVWRTQPAGLVPALRLALARARAPLVARMDADDIAHPERLRRQTEFLAAHPYLAGCGTGVSLFGSEPVGSGYRRYETWINAVRTPHDVRRDMYVECPVAHPTLMLKRSVLGVLGGYREQGWPEDYDLVLRLLAAGMQLANEPRVLHRWRVHPDRLSLQSAVYSTAAFRRCKVHFLRAQVARELTGERPVVVWGAGKVGKPFARELIRQGIRVHAFVDLDPRKIGQSICGAPVLAPEQFGSLVRPYTLGAVGSPGAREEIRAELTHLGQVEIEDFRMVA